MFLAFAVLLFQPATLPQPAATATNNAITEPAVATASETAAPEEALPTASVASSTTEVSAVSSSPIANTADELPAAPTPMVATPIIATPIEQPKPLKNSTVSVAELLAESRHNEHMWFALGIAEHSAATFDAWTTRRAITREGAHELNPLLKPFAGNDSIYAALQVGPLLMDYMGKKMMYSRHSWVRRMWWVPQTASIASSVFCGGHNLAVHSVPN